MSAAADTNSNLLRNALADAKTAATVKSSAQKGKVLQRLLQPAAASHFKKPSSASWYEIQEADVQRDETLKREIRALNLRAAIDPAHHYKAGITVNTSRVQSGTVIDDAAHFYTGAGRSGRSGKRASLVQTLLRDADVQKRLKQKYDALQHASKRPPHRRSSGRKPKK